MSPTEDSGKRAAEGLRLGGLALFYGFGFPVKCGVSGDFRPLSLQHQGQRLLGRVDLGLTEWAGLKLFQTSPLCCAHGNWGGVDESYGR